MAINKNKRNLLLLFILVLLVFIAYSYVYQNHRDIKTEKAAFSITSNEILNEFSINPIEAEKKYLNKTIEVKGEITEKSKSTITLNDLVFCQFSNQISNLLNDNTQIKIKGRVIGYDDLLEQVKLDQCFIIK
jgi:hypothetical protein